MVLMKNAFYKDIFQTIRTSKKRFFSISIITILGVAMFSGLQAGCKDLRESADAFYDGQNLHDLSIVSTLGLTDDDVEALEQVKQVDWVEGIYSETLKAEVCDSDISLTVETLSEKGIDTPYVLEGRLPKTNKEVAVTEKFLSDTNASLNDTLTFDLDEDSNLVNDTFKIVGIVVDIRSIDNPLSATSFRSSNIKDNTVFVTKEAFDNEIYTSISLILDDSASLFCYGDEYIESVKEVKNNIEKTIKSQREKARQDEIYNDAYEEIKKEEDKINKELSDALKELEDGQAEINDGFAQINEAIQTLNENTQNANEQFQSARDTLSKNKQEIESGLSQLEQGQSELNAAKEQLESQAGMTCQEIIANYDESSAQIISGIKSVQQMLEETEDEQTKAYLQEQLTQLNSQKEKLEAAYQGANSILTKQQEIDAKQEQLNEASTLLSNSETLLNQQEASAYAQIQEGWNEIYSNYQTLLDGQSELDDGWKEYNEGKQEAQEEFEKAYKELDDIDVATWYVQDRNSLDGYKNVGSDADSIEGIARVFPAVFFIVAILISLTTITRMVEEDRGLIGTYKALGFTNKEIRRKYIIYSCCACGLGCVIGTFLAFVIIPKVLFIIFSTMYLLPVYYLDFVPNYGIAGPALFLGGILLATIWSCHSELKQMPSILMRPKAPRSGSRVLLEKITFIWKRLSFLNKVTIRNLFRYKKRMCMTIFGIAGCMALLLFGFGVKDSVADLLPRQYEQTFQYDVMAIGDDNEQLVSYVKEDKDVTSYLNLEMTSATIIYNNDELSINMVVVENGEDLKDYISLKDLDYNELSLKDNQIYVTQNAGSVLGFSDGDTISLRLLDLTEAKVPVTTLTKNYLSNYIYMTKSTFESYFEKYEPNCIYLHLKEGCNPVEYGENLSLKDGILNCLSTQDLKNQFSDAFLLINMVVYIIIFMSAALAFVVLFTLATTNISERERELATIKVLGFYNHEVHLYVDKETMILSFIGIILGIPLGRVFVSTLTIILNLPSIYLETSLYLVSYGIAASLCLLFAIAVSLIMDKTLDSINPVEALKSIE